MTCCKLRRILSLVPTAFLIIMFSFAILGLAPEVIENLQRKHALDEPLRRQSLRGLAMSLGVMAPPWASWRQRWSRGPS